MHVVIGDAVEDAANAAAEAVAESSGSAPDSPESLSTPLIVAVGALVLLGAFLLYRYR